MRKIEAGRLHQSGYRLLHAFTCRTWFYYFGSCIRDCHRLIVSDIFACAFDRTFIILHTLHDWQRLS